MLPRVLEPEVMDTPDDAHDYDAMDHAQVNRLFVADLLAAGELSGEVLDVGTGTAQIPIELCRQVPGLTVIALDAAQEMLKLAEHNIQAAGLQSRILPTQNDAKSLPFADGQFRAVISNSIVHHIPQPTRVFAEMHRVTAPGGLLFVRDLFRPDSESELHTLVERYAAGANAHQRQLFADSLRAALTVEEVRQIVAELGFASATVQPSSDRHWTWVARRS